ncbi:2-acylglycerol O-acyltransferase 1 [Echinops telfairi]|uniref:Acyltransferase n=1 Tax=Echinops telfairi TaxID=9371 RepID=A0ABM0IJZ4_ECHTE|nr:2-acylglycerol O-acyltransferase 1 [Echinops telfairi]
MKIEFAPRNIPLARRLQTASVLLWLVLTVLLATICIIIFAILIINNYWFLYIPYLVWFYFDLQTPAQGGRRCHWIRSCIVWRYFMDYFPIHLIKTQDLDLSHNYLFGFHPHGALTAGAFGNFGTNHSAFKKLFPGFTAYLHIISILFICPFFRDILLTTGLVSVSKKSISSRLSRKGGGNISVVVVGGAPELLYAYPGSFTLYIRQRKGFVKLALTHGAHLVPVFSFGENELFDQIGARDRTWIWIFQQKLQKFVGGILPLFYARGIFQYTLGFMPYRKPIHTVVGRPIPVHQTLHPTRQQIEELHQTYLEELSKLFEEHKGKYGIPEHQKLIFK